MRTVFTTSFGELQNGAFSEDEASWACKSQLTVRRHKLIRIYIYIKGYCVFVVNRRIDFPAFAR